MDRKRKIGIILIIVGVILLGSAICMIAGSEYQKAQENTKVIGNIITGSENTEAYAKKIANAMEPLNPSIRSYALSVVKNESEGEFNISQVCDVFDALKSSWAYVEDPNGYDYFAKASESLPLMKGDCDDFAILMASCVEAIGGNTRVNIAFSNAGGHAYAEVCLGNNINDVNRFVDYIKERYGCENVYYSYLVDDYGNKSYWLNLDWWEDHPGGIYFNSVGKILGVHSDGTYYTYSLSNKENAKGNTPTWDMFDIFIIPMFPDFLFPDWDDFFFFPF